MSGLKGIAKNLTASFSSHLVSVLQQVVLTPLYLKNYGAAGFGEWLTLSASVAYLGTLDFGIQTFVNQDLTVRYHRGDMNDFHTQQSTALRMLLGIVTTAAAIALVALVLPIEHWLRMDGSGVGPALPKSAVRGAVYLLSLQVFASIIFGFFSGQFMVLGRAHIGGYWNNIKSLCMIVFALPCLFAHANFCTIALAQLVAVLVCILGVLVTLFRIGRDIFPTLRYWDGGSVTKILKPSGYFALIFSSNFLIYQVPVLLLQRGVGPISVVIFSVTRTIFSMTRNVMNGLTQAIGPEVTTLYARRDWNRLGRLYDYSERLVFALIPIANVGTLFLCPLLLTIWLHRAQMFVPTICILSAAISIVMSAKEHKFQFQFSTNTHRELARFMFVANLATVACWIAVIPGLGVIGLLWTWLVAELAQVLYIMRLNIRFFSAHKFLDIRYPMRLMVFSIILLFAAVIVAPRLPSLPLVEQGTLALGIGLAILAMDVPLFGLAPVLGSVRARLRARFA
jgi:O-antigen/teichoic acid export membrane protein